MRKMLTTMSFGLMVSASMAQVGAVAPDFTITDINGTTHHLYSYLNSGKAVVIDYFATWCGPCWFVHTETLLDELNEEYGPQGTNEVVFIMYEGDASTTDADLHGTGSNTQGDWVTGNPLPLVNESSLSLPYTPYAPIGFPTISLICPSDKTIKYDLYGDCFMVDRPTTLQNMKNAIDDVISTCSISSASVEEQNMLNLQVAPNPVTDQTTVSFTSDGQKAVIEIYGTSGQLIHSQEYATTNGDNFIQLDLADLTEGTYFVKVNTSNQATALIPIMKQ